MFEELLSNNYIATLEEDALVQIRIDRERYANIYNYTIKYVSQNLNNLMISNVDLILDYYIPYYDNIQIYAVNADINAKQLSKELCDEFGERTILKIMEYDQSYVIEYDFRRICTIMSFKIFEKFSIVDFIEPQKCIITSTFDNKIKYNVSLLPPMLEIINLYKDLYTPKLAADWNLIFEKIKKLEVYVDKNILLILKKSDHKGYSGGKQELNNKINFDRFQLKKELLDIIYKPMLVFIAECKYIIVGDIAFKLNHYNKNGGGQNIDITNITDDVFEYISGNSIEYDFELLSNFIYKLFSGNVGLIYEESNIYVPNELLLKKHSFFLITNGNESIRLPLLNIYNNTTFELINYNEIDNIIDTQSPKLRIADPIVQLRFIYIWIWTYILSYRVAQDTKLNKKSSNLYKNYKAGIDKKITMMDFYRIVIDIKEFKQNYIGIYKNLLRQKKINVLTIPMSKKASLYCYALRN
jgi:hypothetical protein